MKRASVLFVCSLFACLMMASMAQAGGFQLFEYSNRGVAMATTGYAIAGDASVIATNPALMTKLEGQRALAGAVTISPQTSVYLDGNKNKTKANIHYVPHAYYTRQLEDNENVWFGIGMFTRFGLGTEYDENWAGKSGLQNVLLESVSLNPNLAFKFNDDFSMAVGLEVIKGGIALKRTIGTSEVSADTEGYAVGGNIGFTYDINDELTAGFHYRAPMRFVAHGKATSGTQNTQNGQTIKSTLPSSFTLGLGYKPMDKWSIEFDTIYTRWENTKSLIYDGLINSETSLKYKNTWRFQLGTEYWAQDWLALRFGYAYDQTPTRAGDASFMLPANDRQLFSTGLGFKWDKWTADWSFMYVIAKERKGLAIDNGLAAAHPAYQKWNVDFKDGKTWITGMSIGYEF
ncbi:outer membrane protein transport protein [Pseudodesulfovibrio sp. zrk46]|uniref:OmpP1/FadL family transporter n=1 Tax=Pseudodesulfovibrio sp. zrk46 TaxID=2725288 RepID=UPI001449FA53|nr:outer membrane protein transport protein [Pseudodesulfovibrio sp. zrk46]QJB58230.1 aromatic hydrocarbon degradation protein [Pseudodesulfovibrio sp. zrk46]